MSKEATSDEAKLADHEEVIDETELDFTVAPLQYDITSFGADFDVEGLVNRLKRGDIFIPPFQRGYVWALREASRFVESILLGLPVPGIFLAKETSSRRLLVIDGQQRLKTLEFFFEGFFDPQEGARQKRVFKLQGVQKKFEDKTYSTLKSEDRITFNDSVLHATIVKQESPPGEQSSIYHIFERLNTTGRKLSPQQIRVAIYHGFFIDVLHELNGYSAWRRIYGLRSKTLKDEELILRFLALYCFSSKYTRPMQDFLNRATENFIRKGPGIEEELGSLFCRAIDFVYAALGNIAFKPERTINAAVFDSIMVGIARRLSLQPPPVLSDFKEAYESLLGKEEYSGLVAKATADDKNMARRLELATSAFESLEPMK
jgi:hypothetical protein